jgi:hypothetical protein
MSGRFEDWNVFYLPPTTNGATLTPKLPTGERAFLLTNAAQEVALSGDIFRAMPDAAGTAATNDFMGHVLVEFFADGDDLCILFGAAAAGLTPDPAAHSASNPANACDVVPANTRQRWMLSTKSQPSMYVRSRAGTAGAKVRYRVVSPLPGAR